MEETEKTGFVGIADLRAASGKVSMGAIIISAVDMLSWPDPIPELAFDHLVTQEELNQITTGGALLTRFVDGEMITRVVTAEELYGLK